MHRILLLCSFLACNIALFAQSFPAINLNGSTGYIKTPNTLDFGTSQDFSLEIRVKTAGWTGDPAILSDKDWNAGKNKGFVISSNTNGQTWKFNIGDGTNRIDMNNGGKINDDLWHTLTVTFSRLGAKRIYQDGRLLQSNNTTFTGNVTSPLANITLGQDGTLVYPYFFNGSVAELRVWNVALDSATVAAWSCQKVNNSHPNYAQLLRYWAFSECAGTSTTDAIAGAVGTLVGGATWTTGSFATPVAGFTAQNAGLNVDFANTSTNASSFAWQFGDGVISSLATPSHVYAQPGVYTVTLTAIGACESNTLTKTITVTNGVSSDYLPGAGRALDFDGVNDYVLVPTNDVLKPTSALTLEAWINVRSFDTDWETVLSFAQDNGGSESGYDLAYVNGKLRFRCKTASMTTNEWDNNPGTEVRYNEWVHIAGVYDGAHIRFYQNGVLQESQDKTGDLNWQFAPVDFRIGAYHDDNEDYYFDGQIDEVRVWSVARTEEELRTTMCKKLKGNENGLVGYWRFDEGAGNTVKNRTGNSLDGTLTNMAALSSRVTSGAAIGEKSIYAYPANWAATTLTLLTADAGSLSVYGMSGNPAGLQLYRVDTLPASLVPAHVIPLSGDYHWGIYPTDRGAQYTASFNYTGNAYANLFEPVIGFGLRSDGAATQWSALTGSLDGTNDILERSGLGGSRQLFLASADFTAVCPFQGTVAATNIGFTSIALEWGSVQNLSSLQWGPTGFQLGSGTQIDNITGANYAVTGLQSDTEYDFYVLDTCPTNQLPGVWFGPYTFKTSSCLAPASFVVGQISTNDALLTWPTGAGTTYDLQWGPSGFALGLGIQYPDVTTPYLLNGLAINKSYDVYLRSNCGTISSSEWIGPITFTTKTVGVSTPGLEQAVLISPNPAKNQFTVKTDDLQAVRLQTPNGQTLPVRAQRTDAQTMQVQTDVTPGLYFLEITTSAGKMLRKIVIGE
ncbi:MAG: LamG-like jellyroll fold domain-containing protein [Bacteroidota bacterium]